jgi:hypothetical protein
MGRPMVSDGDEVSASLLAPSDGDGDRGDAHTDRADVLLGSFAKWPTRSYSLTDLTDPIAAA